MKLITCQVIRDSLKSNLKLVKKNRIWLFDKNYCAIGKNEFEDLRKEIEPINMQFKTELFDCEDFAHVTSAFIKLKAANKYPKGVAFGEVTTRNNQTKEIHTLNFLITENEKAYYFEPQTMEFIVDDLEPFYARI